MREWPTVYIPCAIGNNSFSDLRVERRGDLVRFIGQSVMDFDPESQRRLAWWLLDGLGETMLLMEHHAPDESGDPIVDQVRQQLLERSRAGQLKYGKTLARTDLEVADWAHHAAEESLDMALYLTRLETDLRARMDDGR
jgi:hypothetical protein